MNPLNASNASDPPPLNHINKVHVVHPAPANPLQILILLCSTRNCSTVCTYPNGISVCTPAHTWNIRKTRLCLCPEHSCTIPTPPGGPSHTHRIIWSQSHLACPHPSSLNDPEQLQLARWPFPIRPNVSDPPSLLCHTPSPSGLKSGINASMPHCQQLYTIL